MGILYILIIRFIYRKTIALLLLFEFIQMIQACQHNILACLLYFARQKHFIQDGINLIYCY
jgi:hypothetical protein